MKSLLQLFKLGPDHGPTVWLSLVLVVIVLVIVLGAIKHAERDDLGNDRRPEQARGVELLLGVFGEFLLLVVVVEDHRAILSAHIVALPVLCGRVVRVIEDRKEV